MPISGSFHSFTRDEIARAPEAPGVYQLDTNTELIYYGSSTVSIRGRLASHYAGNEGPCTQQATFFKTEVSYRAREREQQLLTEYVTLHGRLPRCNDVRP